MSQSPDEPGVLETDEHNLDARAAGHATAVLAADAEVEAFHGVTFPGLYAMIARAHMAQFGTTKEEIFIGYETLVDKMGRDEADVAARRDRQVAIFGGDVDGAAEGGHRFEGSHRIEGSGRFAHGLLLPLSTGGGESFTGFVLASRVWV